MTARVPDIRYFTNDLPISATRSVAPLYFPLTASMTASPKELDLRETPEGTLLKVKVSPSARRNAVGGVHARMLRVSVTTAPEKGKANREVVSLLAGVLGIPPRDLFVVAGEHAPRKQILVRGLTANEIRNRLESSRS